MREISLTNVRMLNKLSLSLVNQLLGVIILITFNLYSTAQNDTVQLDEIEVYGIRPELSTSSSSPVQQMTSRKIQAIPTASVAEAIRNFSGVVIKDYGGVGGLKTVMIRSMGSNHTSVFVDGLPSGDAATGQIDLGKISLQDVNEIKLAVGQPEFGLMPARMHSSASILNIRSREHDFSENANILNLSTRAGSFGTINPSMAFDTRINKHTNAGMRISYFKTKGDFPYNINNGNVVTDSRRNNSDVQSFDISLKGRIQLRDSSRFIIKATYFNSDRGLPGAVILYNPYSKQRLINKDFNLGLSYKVSLTSITKMVVSAGATNLYLLYTDPSFHNQSGGLKNHFNQQEYFISDAFSFSISPTLTLAAATDVIINKLSTNAYSIENPLRVTSYTAFSFLYHAPLKVEIQGTALLTGAFDKTNESDHKSFHKLSPGISLLRPVTSDGSLKVRLMYKNIFRMPTFNDLYYAIAGNNDLLPEKASLYNVGLIYSNSFNQRTALNLRADVFANTVKDKIVTVPTQNLFIWRTQNIGKADIKGVEVFAGVIRQLNKDWSFDINGTYTYQDARDMSDSRAESYKNQLAYIPYETAGGLFTAFFKNYSLGVNTLYNGYRFSSSINNPENMLNAWITTDVTVAWQKLIKKNTFSIKFEVSNLYNSQYEIVKNFPMTGRAFYINLNVTL